MADWWKPLIEKHPHMITDTFRADPAWMDRKDVFAVGCVSSVEYPSGPGLARSEDDVVVDDDGNVLGIAPAKWGIRTLAHNGMAYWTKQR